MVQSDLDRLVEHFHYLLEHEIEKFYSIANAKHEIFFHFKTEVTNLTGLSKDVFFPFNVFISLSASKIPKL